MGYRRFAARLGKPDANAAAIIKALKACGASVIDLHAVGGGCPDILVGFRRGENSEAALMVLMEIKVSDKAQSHVSTREKQAKFAADWRGAPVVTVRSEAEALAVIGIRLNE